MSNQMNNGDPYLNEQSLPGGQSVPYDSYDQLQTHRTFDTLKIMLVSAFIYGCLNFLSCTVQMLLLPISLDLPVLHQIKSNNFFIFLTSLFFAVVGAALLRSLKKYKYNDQTKLFVPPLVIWVISLLIPMIKLFYNQFIGSGYSKPLLIEWLLIGAISVVYITTLLYILMDMRQDGRHLKISQRLAAVFLFMKLAVATFNIVSAIKYCLETLERIPEALDFSHHLAPWVTMTASVTADLLNLLLPIVLVALLFKLIPAVQDEKRQGVLVN